MRGVRSAWTGMLLAAVAAVVWAVATPAGAAMDDMTGGCAATGTTVSISAHDNMFDTNCLAVPADTPFTISFNNRDPVAHNVALLRHHGDTHTLFHGELVNGPGSITYPVGSLPAGRYHFHCEVHPTAMMGTFVVAAPAVASPAPAAVPGPDGGQASTSDRTGGSLTPRPVKSLTPMRTLVLCAGVGCALFGGVMLARSRRRRATGDTPPAAPAGPIGRRELIRLGAAGTAGAAVAGVAASTFGRSASAAPTGRGVHIHGTVVYRGTPPVGIGPGQAAAQPGTADTGMGGMGTTGMEMAGMGMARMAATDYMHVINIDVFGPDDDLSGSGWGATTDATNPRQPVPVDGLQCFYTQRGSISGNVVKLAGRMLFSGDPGDPGGTITTEADLDTGTIRWIGTANKAAQFMFEGKGVVVRL